MNLPGEIRIDNEVLIVRTLVQRNQVSSCGPGLCNWFEVTIVPEEERTMKSAKNLVLGQNYARYKLQENQGVLFNSQGFRDSFTKLVHNCQEIALAKPGGVEADLSVR
jgi:hypothetical protein